MQSCLLTFTHMHTHERAPLYTRTHKCARTHIYRFGWPGLSKRGEVPDLCVGCSQRCKGLVKGK